MGPLHVHCLDPIQHQRQADSPDLFHRDPTAEEVPILQRKVFDPVGDIESNLRGGAAARNRWIAEPELAAVALERVDNLRADYRRLLCEAVGTGSDWIPRLRVDKDNDIKRHQLSQEQAVD